MLLESANLLVWSMKFHMFDDGVILPHKVDNFTRALRACEKVIVFNGELALGEDLEEFIADHARRADDGEIDFSHNASVIWAFLRLICHKC